ncbi:hypothetical protein K474DRAFT_1712639 [Panus rudis PR-1116 ss-1]|nr:hypothetical protein K474DRAFT_1712639 [Panus rudis PR-1116 ss-1]
MFLQQLLPYLTRRPELLRYLTLDNLLLCVHLLQSLKPYISWQQNGRSGPPLTLPANVKRFLASSLQLRALSMRTQQEVLDDCWDVVRHMVWAPTVLNHEPLAHLRSCELLDIFLTHGLAEDIAFHTFYPPVRECLDPQCTHVNRGRGEVLEQGQRALTGIKYIKCVYFSRDFGPVPALSFSAHCQNCYTRYYPCYYVHGHRSERTYYGGAIPAAIHVSTHSFLETSLCASFTASMVHAWVSSANNARIYNDQHQDAILCYPPAWGKSHILDGPKVLDAFFLLTLLRHHHEYAAKPLILQNNAPRQIRINAALYERNLHIVEHGQEEWAHVCNQCCATRVVDGQESIIRAVVTDGVTVGHPCCSVHDCQGRLPTQQHRFCSDHAHLDGRCRIIGCTADAEVGFRTCSEATHHALDRTNNEALSALFQLKGRLERHKMAHLNNSASTTDSDVPDGEVSTVDASPEPSSSVAPKLRARFGRRWTHNEQLCVSTCGVILGRATFYGSEAVSAVRLFLKKLFPTKQSVPQCLFYDYACGLKRHLLAEGDTHFDHCALPVDVFHMRSKHAESDEFCGQHCNPAQFEDLYAGGQWHFNSSAAEMTNAWFVGFNAMVREMCQERYEFFLDEMIKQRNRMLVGELEKHAQSPHRLDENWLRGVDVES